MRRASAYTTEMRNWRLLGRALGIAAILVPAGCVLAPTGWDARTDGGRYPADRHGANPRDPARRGIDDMRSEAQNDLCVGGFKIRIR